jgi:hypothetical protein
LSSVYPELVYPELDEGKGRNAGRSKERVTLSNSSGLWEKILDGNQLPINWALFSMQKRIDNYLLNHWHALVKTIPLFKTPDLCECLLND